MKILLTCDPEIPVPPKGYGGIERIIDGLAQSYQKQGHEVFLLANHESSCIYAQQIFPWPAMHSRGIFNVIKNSLELWEVCHKLKPDVVHSFSRLLYMYPVFL